MYERLPVNASPEVVVAARRDVLRERGVTEYAVVDHGHDMAAARQPAFPAWTLIFGNPAAGARLLKFDLAAAVDIPLRLAVIGRGGHPAAPRRDRPRRRKRDRPERHAESRRSPTTCAA